MQIQNSQDKVTRFLERKFRVSQSLSTRNTYNSAIQKFIEFLEVQYGFGLLEILKEIESKDTDPVDVLDNFYSFMSQFKRENSEKIGYSNHTICDYIIVTKEFLNEEGGKIYNEDIKQKFRLPHKIHVYEKGLTKETINRIIRLANPKLGVGILISCSGGMRIGKITQLR